jgi:hypothetical protein
MSSQLPDFAPLPSYSQTTTKNESWVNVTVTRTDPRRKQEPSFNHCAQSKVSESGR